MLLSSFVKTMIVVSFTQGHWCYIALTKSNYYLLSTTYHLGWPHAETNFSGGFFWWFSMSKSVVHWEFRLFFSSSPLQDFATTWSFFVKLMAQISCLEHIRRGNLILKTILLSSERWRSQDGFVTFFTSCHSWVWHLVKTVGVWGYYCLVRNTSTKFNFQTERLSWQKKSAVLVLRGPDEKYVKTNLLSSWSSPNDVLGSISC